MPNDSATGGPLTPSSSPAYGLTLNTIIQNWMVPLIGLAGTHVVIYDQPEPPNIPAAGDAFAAVRVSIGASDPFPFVGHVPASGGGQGVDQLQRHETIVCLASFYDLGSGGLAQSYLAMFRDGTAIAQNREPLYANAMALVSMGEPLAVPMLFKQRWMYRADLPFTLRRQVTRDYPVLNILTGNIELDANVEGPPGLITRTIPIHP